MSEVVSYNYIIRMNKEEILQNREAINNYLKAKILRNRTYFKNARRNKRLLNDVISFWFRRGIDLNSYLDKEVVEWLQKKK